MLDCLLKRNRNGSPFLMKPILFFLKKYFEGLSLSARVYLPNINIKKQCISGFKKQKNINKKIELVGLIKSFKSLRFVASNNSFLKSSLYKQDFFRSKKFNFIRSSRDFNKSSFSRVRQICYNIVFLGLYINVFFINELHRSFYGINISYISVLGFIIWPLSFFIIVKLFLNFKKLYVQKYFEKSVHNIFFSNSSCV